MYRYGRAARGYTSFQAFKNVSGLSADQPRVVSKGKALLDTLIILLQSRNNITEIRPLRGVWCPAALDKVCKCRLTTSWQWRSLILPFNLDIRKKISIQLSHSAQVLRQVKCNCMPFHFLNKYRRKNMRNSICLCLPFDKNSRPEGPYMHAGKGSCKRVGAEHIKHLMP